MAGSRKLKHIYDDNWVDKNQFKTDSAVDPEQEDPPEPEEEWEEIILD